MVCDDDFVMPCRILDVLGGWRSDYVDHVRMMTPEWLQDLLPLSSLGGHLIPPVTACSNNRSKSNRLLSIIRPHRVHDSVHKMRHAATDVARSVICMYVCWSRGCTAQKRSEPIEMPFAVHRWPQGTMY